MNLGGKVANEVIEHTMDISKNKKGEVAIMRYTVQYIPLSKIRPGFSAKLTNRVRELRKAAQDCMHLMIVRKSKKEGGYVVVSGTNHLEYLKKYTKKSSAPCLVDESKASPVWLHCFTVSGNANYRLRSRS